MDQLGLASYQGGSTFCGLGSDVDVGGPDGGVGWMISAESRNGGMQCLSRRVSVGLAIGGGEGAVDGVRHDRCVFILNRPQCGDDVAVSGELEGRGEVDRLVDKSYAADCGLAGTQVHQFGVVQLLFGDVEHRQRPVPQKDRAAGRIQDVLFAVTGPVNPGMVCHALEHGFAGGLLADELNDGADGKYRLTADSSEATAGSGCGRPGVSGIPTTSMAPGGPTARRRAPSNAVRVVL